MESHSAAAEALGALSMGELTTVASYAILTRSLLLLPVGSAGLGAAEDHRLAEVLRTPLPSPVVLGLLACLAEAALFGMAYDLAARYLSSTDDGIHLAARAARLCRGETREHEQWLACLSTHGSMTPPPRLARVVATAGIPNVLMHSVLVHGRLGATAEQSSASPLNRSLFQHALRGATTLSSYQEP